MEQTLTKDEQELLYDGKCPDCQGHLSLHARGGSAINVKCVNCHHKFWVAPLFTPKRIVEKETE